MSGFAVEFSRHPPRPPLVLGLGSIPETPPQYWTAEGGTQGQWTALRQHCIDTLAEIGRRAPMSATELRGLPPIPGDAESCRNLSGSFSRAAQAAAGSSPAPAPSGGTPPTPMPTPLPPEFPVGPQSLEPDTSDPPATGQSFAGGGASALVGASVGAQTPSAAPIAAITRFTISEKPPEFWAADGGTQASWMAFRQRCADIGAELTRRQGMTYKQFEASPGLSFSRDEMLRCSHLSVSAGQAGPALSPSPSSAGISPTPITTPLPPEFPVGPQSLAPDTSDPPATAVDS